MKSVKLLGCLLVGLLVTGCGYHVPAAGSKWAGEGARTLYVELFANRTAEPYLDTVLTDEVSAQFSRSRLVELTDLRGDADLLIVGTVNSFSSSAQAYNARDKVSEYRAQIAATVQLVRRADNAILWRGDLSRTETYSSQDDKSQQQIGESAAARVASRRLAEDLMSRLLDDF